MTRRAVLVLAAVAALALPACGQESSSKPAPAPTSSTAPPTPSTPQLTVTHVLIGFQGPMEGVTRSKADALRLAKSLLVEVQDGRSFDELVGKHSEDRGPGGQPNTNNGKPGSYTWPTRQIPQMDPAFERASRATPVGKMAPEPVETVYGYHLIRRDS